MTKPTRDQMTAAARAEGANPDEVTASAELFDALRAQRTDVSRSKELSEGRLAALSDHIKNDASKRSQEIAAAPNVDFQQQGAPIPWWLWLALLVALAALVYVALL